MRLLLLTNWICILTIHPTHNSSFIPKNFSYFPIVFILTIIHLHVPIFLYVIPIFYNHLVFLIHIIIIVDYFIPTHVPNSI